MASEIASRDQNQVPTLIGVSSSDGTSIVKVWVDPNTHRLLVSGSGLVGFQQPTGTVNGVNTTFIFTNAPNAIVIDGVTKQKVGSDGTINWTGTTTVVLSVPPAFDIFSVA